MKKWYELTAVPSKTLMATARYKYKLLRKGKEYKVRRKADAEQVAWMMKNAKLLGYTKLKAKVI